MISDCLILSHEYPPGGGGAGKAVQAFARRLPEFRVLTMRMAGREVDSQVWEIPPRRIDPSRLSLGRMALFAATALHAVIRLPRRQRPRIIIAFFTLPAGLAALAVHTLFGTPYILSLRGGDVPGFMPDTLGGYHRLLGPLIRLIWRRAWRVTANGSYLTELAQRFMPGLDVVNLPNGVEKPVLLPRPAQPLRVAFASRLVLEQKGLEELPGVWKALQRKHASLRPQLHIYGDGPARTWLEQELSETDVVFHGWAPRSELLADLRQTHVFVHLSRYEGLSNSLLEALAAGCLVILQQSPCNREVISAAGVFTSVEDLRIEDFSRFSQANHDFSTRFDWDESTRILWRLLENGKAETFRK